MYSGGPQSQQQSLNNGSRQIPKHPFSSKNNQKNQNMLNTFSNDHSIDSNSSMGKIKDLCKEEKQKVNSLIQIGELIKKNVEEKTKRQQLEEQYQQLKQQYDEKISNLSKEKQNLIQNQEQLQNNFKNSIDIIKSLQDQKKQAEKMTIKDNQIKNIEKNDSQQDQDNKDEKKILTFKNYINTQITTELPEQKRERSTSKDRFLLKKKEGETESLIQKILPKQDDQVKKELYNQVSQMKQEAYNIRSQFLVIYQLKNISERQTQNIETNQQIQLVNNNANKIIRHQIVNSQKSSNSISPFKQPDKNQQKNINMFESSIFVDENQQEEREKMKQFDNQFQDNLFQTQIQEEQSNVNNYSSKQQQRENIPINYDKFIPEKQNQNHFGQPRLIEQSCHDQPRDINILPNQEKEIIEQKMNLYKNIERRYIRNEHLEQEENPALDEDSFMLNLQKLDEQSFKYKAQKNIQNNQKILEQMKDSKQLIKGINSSKKLETQQVKQQEKQQLDPKIQQNRILNPYPNLEQLNQIANKICEEKSSKENNWEDYLTELKKNEFLKQQTVSKVQIDDKMDFYDDSLFDMGKTFYLVDQVEQAEMSRQSFQYSFQ